MHPIGHIRRRHGAGSAGAAIAIALVAATSGCADTSGAKAPPVHNAALLVGIQYRGGPPPGRPHTLEPGRVDLLFSDGRPLAHAKVRRGHRARFSVGAGSYRLTASSGSAHCLRRSVTARAGKTTRVAVICSVK